MAKMTFLHRMSGFFCRAGVFGTSQRGAAALLLKVRWIRELRCHLLGFSSPFPQKETKDTLGELHLPACLGVSLDSSGSGQEF